jgi:DNA-binding transcriptional LysR family regulator
MSKAAENLHITQQGLSIAMRRLETELGHDLFYRKQNGLVLTDNGKFFKSEAEGIIRNVDKIKNYFADQSVEKTVINMTVTESIIVRLPISLQQLLINGNDDFSLNLVESYSKNCADMVFNNESDFGIIYGTCEEKKLEYITLDSVKQVIIVNRNHPFSAYDEVSIRDLSGLPFVAPDKFSWPRINLSNMFTDHGAELNIVYECNRPRQTIDLVSNNPKLVARTIEDEISKRDLDKIKILHLKDDPFLMPINLITRKDRALNSSDRIFKNLIINAFK